MVQQRFYFCPRCGGKLSYVLYDQRERLTCEACQFIMYENPIVGVAGILIREGRILLGRRSQSSTYPGLWCIPCGYVEYEEEVREALKREFREETGLQVEPQNVFAVLSNFHNPACHTVGIWFIVTQTGGSLTAGDDLDQAAFFPLDAIPPLAFPTDRTVLDMLAKGRKTGDSSVADSAG